jgi:lauroyl/myristoyl acyltransferase/predicted MFS family arabinose efflux permease
MSGSRDFLSDGREGHAPSGFVALFRNANFSLLWSSTLTSQLGDHLNLMALTALIFSLSAGAIRGLEFSKILLLASVPVLVFGPISGVYADRYSRKKLMIVSDFVRAALVALIPLLARSMVPVYVIVFLVFTINRFYLSAKSAAIPQIVQPRQLLEANSLLNVAMMATIMIGPWGGGILVQKLGYTAGFLADAATYVVSGSLAAFLTLRSIADVERSRLGLVAARRRAIRDTAREALRIQSPSELAEGAARITQEIAAPIEEEVEVIGSAYQRLVADLRDGVARMRGHPFVVYSTVSYSAVMFVAGFVLVVCPVLVRNEFGSGTAELGMLFSAAGIGMLMGSLIVGKFLRGVPMRGIIAVSFAAVGIAIAVLSFAASIPTLGLWIFLTGAFVAPTLVSCDTILQENMPGEAIGKAFGLRDMAGKAAFGVAGILSGVIVDVIGPRHLLIAIAAACVAYGFLSIFIFADTSKANLLNAYPIMRLGAALAASLPRRVSYGAARALSAFAHLVFADKRRWARENVARVVSESPDSAVVKLLAQKMFRSYGLYWADFFTLNGRYAESVKRLVRITGLEHLRNALRRGKGAIFVTAHLGSWDVGGAALSDQPGLPPFSAIVEPVSTQASDFAMTTMRERRGIHVIPLGKVLAVGRALRRNEVVFVVGDRLVGADGVEVDFFGRRTIFPRGAAYWAARSGAAIVAGFCVREPDGSYTGYIEEPLIPAPGDDSPSGVQLLTQRIARIMERYIARYPDQWCMLQPAWTEAGEGS